jgi:hypothetical protein
MAKKGQFKAGATADSIRQRKYNESPLQKKRRAERNAARRKLEKEGKVHKGDGKDVDHKNMDTADNSSKNLHAISVNANRKKNKHHLKDHGRKN